MLLPRKPNAFVKTMLHFDFGDAEADLFSQSCVEQYDSRPTHTYGYLFAQVFEPFVLDEVAALAEMPRAAVERLSVGDSDRLDCLREEARTIGHGSPVKEVNVAAALISLSRFKLAQAILEDIDMERCANRDVFEMAMLKFVISNRLADGFGARDAFHVMKHAIQADKIPVNRVMDAASQAVVWHVKSKQVDASTFDWFLALGTKLMQKGVRIDTGAQSSWYRAIAMLPASHGDRVRTRELMIRAKFAAEETMSTRPRSYELHFRKTYHESALREYMYVTAEQDAALSEAAALIAIDPHWSVSYGERAEVCAHFGDFLSAAEDFELAAQLGPPYVGHHFFCAGQAWERAGELERALDIYESLFDFDKRNSSVIVAGLRLARRLGATTCEKFNTAFVAISDTLSSEQRAYLAG